MKVRLKSRKKIKTKLIKGLIVFLALFISFVLSFKFLYDKIDVSMNNNTYIDYLVSDSFKTYSMEDIASLSSMEFLLKYSLGIENFNSGVELNITTPVEQEVSSNPLVYIYNTHQTESYQSNMLESFNINNTVYLGSFILGEYLNDLGISSYVETGSIVDILNTNGWKYGSSYKASRILMEQALKDNPSLMFFIDLHRDSASYERTTVEIEGIKYAKVMFVVGLEHDNYQENLDVANKLNDILNSINSSLSRGVLEKQGSGVNGIYNQDFNKNTILIEVGGQYNYIEEVNNTLKIMADVIYEYLSGLS